jgi:hypothetical protein
MLAAVLVENYIAIDTSIILPIVSAVLAGYAALGGTLIWSLKTTTTQLDKANTQYINALQSTVAESNKTQVMMVERLTETLTTIREMAATNRSEHSTMSSTMMEQNRAILDALGKVGRSAPSNNQAS